MDKYHNRQTLKTTSLASSLVSTTKNGKKRPSIRALRWFCIIGVHLLFLLSFYADVQILEGDISGSRMLGFHLADPFITLEVIAAYAHLPVNLLIGSASILLFYFVFGGRAFCAWVCPYGLLSEIGEKINSNLVAKKIIKKREINFKARYVIWVAFLMASFFSGILVFEIINVVGILSRFIIYGFSVAIFLVLIVLGVEIFFARRIWCASFCPLGTSYSLLSKLSLTKISWDKQKCDHCGVCIDVCFVSHVLEITKKNAKNTNENRQKFSLKGVDCTLCGRCIDVCHHDALGVSNGLKEMI